MENENYHVMPTELHNCGCGSKNDVDQRWFRQIRYVHAMIDILYTQKIITNETAVCIGRAISELYSIYSDMQCAVRSETINDLKQDGIRPNCD